LSIGAGTPKQELQRDGASRALWIKIALLKR
jgi:hypothetical protein